MYYYSNRIIKIFIILSLLIFLSCDSQYNKANSSLDIPLILPPYQIKASQGESLDEITISWMQSSLINEVFIYRSEKVDGPYQKIGSKSYKFMFSDTEVEPGKIYYYKLKGYNLLYGESNFSNPVSGYRAGLSLDQYENDNSLDNAKKILIDYVQTRSIYPKNDIDFIKFDATGDNIYTIETLSTGNEKDDCKFIRIYLYDSNYNLLRDNDYSYDNSIYTRKITKWLCQMSGTYYILVISIYGTGGYKIRITLGNEPPDRVQYVTPSYGTNSNFIKINWIFAYGAEKYYLYKSDNISGPYNQIEFYRTIYSTQKFNFTTLTEAYDKDVVAGKIYYYKVKAINIFGESQLSIAGGGFMADLTNDSFEDDNTTDLAKTIETTPQERTLYPASDIDWIKFSGKKGYYYKISTNPRNEYNAEVDTILYLYDSEENLLTYNDNNSSSNYSLILNWFCDSTSDYFLKIVSKDNFSGTYVLEVKESPYYFR
ncbi:MAG TPA: hypothetical protein PK351_12385 [Spirochaetota bacterium]|nr:hypothetical protein [Spirochaetota bacterium]